MDINRIKQVKTKRIGKKLLYFDEINSTHTFAKDNIDKIEDGTVILADKQTEGKGTKGRKWYTGSNLNIAMTIILKPNCNIENIKNLTVDVAKIIQNIIKVQYDCDLDIKEPNDLILKERKISGILTESSTIGNKLNYIILSIGFNVNEENFNEETKNIATSLKREYKREFSREEIVFYIIENIDKYYIKFSLK